MPEDHERIEQLLAGHALGTLSGEDAIQADRLLAEHVPTCPLCRETLAGFRGVVDRLPLAVAPMNAPDLLVARLRRSLREPEAGRRRGAFVAAAAGVAALVGMAALSMSLGSRATVAESHLDRMAELVDAIAQPGAAPVSLQPTSVDATPLVEVSGPTLERMIVAGHNVPQPGRDSVYVLWVRSSTGEVHRLGTLMPDASGFVFETFRVDGGSIAQILITEERLGSATDTPRADSPHTWQASL
jgi:Anti-sigma-K factor rskA